MLPALMSTSAAGPAASSIQHAIFDFDGTLADSVDHVIELYNAAAGWLRVRRVTREDVKHLRTLKPMEAIKAMDVPMWKLPLLVRSVRRGMRKRIRNLDSFPGLDAALAGLREGGVRCYVLSTNSTENIEVFLAHHGLTFFHELEGGSSLFGKAKHLKKFIAKQGLDPARTLYVGDEVRDIHAAREAGLRCVSVTWGYSEREALRAEHPFALVDTPAELLTALKGA
ncbi:MAG: hypothetical protein RL385_5088 [Pseudomonadota bacterium]